MPIHLLRASEAQSYHAKPARKANAMRRHARGRLFPLLHEKASGKSEGVFSFPIHALPPASASQKQTLTSSLAAAGGLSPHRPSSAEGPFVTSCFLQRDSTAGEENQPLPEAGRTRLSRCVPNVTLAASE